MAASSPLSNRAFPRAASRLGFQPLPTCSSRLSLPRKELTMKRIASLPRDRRALDPAPVVHAFVASRREGRLQALNEPRRLFCETATARSSRWRTTTKGTRGSARRPSRLLGARRSTLRRCRHRSPRCLHCPAGRILRRPVPARPLGLWLKLTVAPSAPQGGGGRSPQRHDRGHLHVGEYDILIPGPEARGSRPG